MSAQPTEEQLRAYEEELSRITSTQIVVQTVASLLSVGGRRLGLAEGSEGERDLEQVRDAIDGARALLPIVERRMPAGQLGPLKDALAQLQMAYARLASAGGQEGESAAKPAAAGAREGAGAEGGAGAGQGADGGGQPAGGGQGGDGSGGSAEPAAGESKPADGEGAGRGQQDQGRRPGPAESSGRLWVPGR